MKVPKGMMRKKKSSKEDEQTLAELSSDHRHLLPLASKMSGSTNQLHYTNEIALVCCIINML